MSIIINGIQPKIIHSYSTRTKVPAKPVGQGMDSVEVSENATLFANAMKAAQESVSKGTDIQRISDISGAISEGSYSVDSYALAGKIMEPGEGWQA